VAENGLDGMWLEDGRDDFQGATAQPLQRWRASAEDSVADAIWAGSHIDAEDAITVYSS
jgi:hypothetical protein